MIPASSFRLYRQDRLWTLTGTQSLGNISLPFFKTNHFIWKLFTLNFALFLQQTLFPSKVVYSSEAVLTNHYEIRKAQQVGKQEEGGNVWNLPFLYNSILANAIFKKKHLLNLTSFLFIHRWCPKSSNLDTVRWQKCPTEPFEVL